MDWLCVAATKLSDLQFLQFDRLERFLVLVAECKLAFHGWNLHEDQL